MTLRFLVDHVGYRAGTVHEVSVELAGPILAAGLAEAVPEPVETAALESGPEKATLPAGAHRKRAR